jgi:nucleoside-diphosphate kinase
MMTDLERTLIILKPDAIQRGLVGPIITRFERAGLKIVAMKMASPDELHFHKHYEEISGLISRWGEDVYRSQIAQMMDSPVIAFVLEGVEVVSYVRKLVGTTDPKEAAPGTIRGDFTHVTRAYTETVGSGLPTILHASGNPEEAAQEIALWFDRSEIFSDYEVVHAPIIRGKIIKPKK